MTAFPMSDIGLQSSTGLTAQLAPSEIEARHPKSGRSCMFRLDGSLVWKIRNGMIHEIGAQFKEFGFERVLFTVPHPRMPLATLDLATMRYDGGELILNLDLLRFVDRIITGCERWLAAIENDEEKQSRLNRLIQFRPKGLPPYVVGLPMIA